VLAGVGGGERVVQRDGRFPEPLLMVVAAPPSVLVNRTVPR
jgi:hypothetical protein